MDLLTGMRTFDLDALEDAGAARKQSLGMRLVHNVV